MQENWFIRDNCIDVTLEMRPTTRNFINAWILFGRCNVWITYRRAFLLLLSTDLQFSRWIGAEIPLWRKIIIHTRQMIKVYRMAVLNKSNRRVNHRVIINIYESRRKRVAYIYSSWSIIFPSWLFYLKIFFFLPPLHISSPPSFLFFSILFRLIAVV